MDTIKPIPGGVWIDRRGFVVFGRELIARMKQAGMDTGMVEDAPARFRITVGDNTYFRA